MALGGTYEEGDNFLFVKITKTDKIMRMFYDMINKYIEIRVLFDNGNMVITGKGRKLTKTELFSYFAERAGFLEINSPSDGKKTALFVQKYGDFKNNLTITMAQKRHYLAKQSKKKSGYFDILYMYRIVWRWNCDYQSIRKMGSKE